MKYIVNKFGMIKEQKSKKGVVEIINSVNQNFKFKKLDLKDVETDGANLVLRTFVRDGTDSVVVPIVIQNIVDAAEYLRQKIKDEIVEFNK